MTRSEQIAILKLFRKIVKRTCVQCFRHTYKVPIAELVDQLNEEIGLLEWREGADEELRKPAHAKGMRR